MTELVKVAIGNEIFEMTREEAQLPPLPTQAELDEEASAKARAVRNKALLGSDWVVVKAYEQGESVPTDWAEYRQDLRDVTGQVGFPHNVVWPVAP